MILARICGVLAVVLGLGAGAPATAQELAERQAIAREVRDLAWRGDFTRLEAMAEEFRAKQSRTSSGLWKLGSFHDGVSDFLDSCAVSCAEILSNWRERYPDSITVRLAEAQLFLLWAWEHRGDGYADEVKEEAWEPFYDNIAKARTYLVANKRIASVDPTWYVQMAVIAEAEGWPTHEFSAMINEGLDRTPSYYPLYFSAIEFYAPKWGGNAAAIEDFARAAVRRSAATEGFGLYARIYWYAAEIQYRDNLFTDSNVVWRDMKAGIDDVLKSYPSQWNINHFAYFSCLVSDYGKARELMQRIVGPADPVVWGPGWDFERCKWWAEMVAD